MAAPDIVSGVWWPLVLSLRARTCWEVARLAKRRCRVRAATLQTVAPDFDFHSVWGTAGGGDHRWLIPQGSQHQARCVAGGLQPFCGATVLTVGQ